LNNLTLSGTLKLLDDKTLTLGTGSDITVGYDETTTDSLKIAATEAAGLAITLMADEGDDAGDEWKLNIADGGTLTLGNDIASAGTYVTGLTITPHATTASWLLDFEGDVDVGGDTLSFNGAATIDTSGNNALSLDAGSAVLTLDGGTLESDASTLSFDAAATIDTSGNNALTLDAGSAVLTLDGGTLESDATTLSFDAATSIDTSGNNNLTLSAGTATLGVTAGDVTIYDDNNNADTSLSIGTSATEALVVQALNGASNKTLEELRFTTKTASGTANHGKMSFYVDEVNIGNINDGGITLESGMVLTGNVTGNASGTAATVTGGTQAAITTCTNLVTTGALNSGSITSGFGTINNGSSTITTTGALSAGATTISGDTVISNGYGLIVGNGSQVTANTIVGEVQQLGTANADTTTTLGRWSADATSSRMLFVKSRNGTIGSSTIVQDDDDLGNIGFVADDGSDFAHLAASITASVDGTPGANDVPGRLVFSTTADGASSPTERMRIESAGHVNVGGYTNTTATVGKAISLHVGNFSSSAGILISANPSSVQQPTTSQIAFSDTVNTTMQGWINYTHSTSEYMDFGVAEATRMAINATGVGIGVVPAGRTANLEILYTQSDAIKITDADVAHGMTSLTDTDCFGSLAIAHGTEGGIRTSGFTEGSKAVVLAANATSGDTTKSTSAVGAVYWDCAEKNGTDVHAFDANENLFVITNRETARFIFDSDGDGHADSAWTTFDKHDDIAMLHDIEATMVPDTFGKAMKYDAPYLEKIGIIGAGSLREENGKTRGMINYTRLQMLHHGAIRQVHQQLQDAKEFYEDKLAALEQRLLRLEA